MDTGTLGTRRPLNLDALSTEAAATVGGAADKLRGLIQLLGNAYQEAVANGDAAHGPTANDLARARELLGRLEIAERGVRDTVTLVEQERGATVDQPVPADPALRMAVLHAQEQERARLANELHDGPAQALANLIFQTEIVDRAVDKDARTGQRELHALRQMLQAELEMLRAYINQLRPPLVESEGLNDALREAAQRLTEHDGITVELRLDANADVIDEIARSAALRIAQEALRNISKHAGARRAWVHTRLEPTSERPADGGEDADGDEAGRDLAGEHWVMEVGDDGRGFDVDAISSSANRRHFGLRFMRERSELLGAQLSIETHPDAGTVVRLAIATRGKGKQSA